MELLSKCWVRKHKNIIFDQFDYRKFPSNNKMENDNFHQRINKIENVKEHKSDITILFLLGRWDLENY